jgi:hypothetical protein
MNESYAEWFARWSREMASGEGSGRVPPLEEATVTSSPSAGKPGNKRFPRNRSRSRVPPYSSGQVRKL